MVPRFGDFLFSLVATQPADSQWRNKQEEKNCKPRDHSLAQPCTNYIWYLVVNVSDQLPLQGYSFHNLSIITLITPPLAHLAHCTVAGPRGSLTLPPPPPMPDARSSVKAFGGLSLCPSVQSEVRYRCVILGNSGEGENIKHAQLLEEKQYWVRCPPKQGFSLTPRALRAIQDKLAPELC